MNELIINTTQKKDISNNQDLTKPRQRVKYWDKDYIDATLDTIQNKVHKLFFFLLWRTGVRVTEAISLQKRNVDLDNYTLEIKWLKKRRYETRLIPLHPDLRNVLDYYASTLKADDRLFDFSRQRADQLAKKYFKGSCHMFRHSFAVNWLRSQGDLYLLSKMLGHSSITVTEIYLEIVPVDVGKELLKIQF